MLTVNFRKLHQSLSKVIVSFGKLSQKEEANCFWNNHRPVFVFLFECKFQLSKLKTMQYNRENNDGVIMQQFESLQ